MIYKRAFDHRTYQQPIHDGDFVQAVVCDEARYHDGELEILRAQVEKLTEVVGRLFVHASDRTKKEIAEALMWEAKAER